MVSNRLSAHLGYLFNQLPMESRIEAAAKAGFTAVEHPQPFVVEARQMREELRRHDLVFSQIAAAVGDAGKGEKGLAALPGREADFREEFKRSLGYALEIGCPLIHPMAGVPEGGPGDAATETYRRNIDFAVESTASVPVKVLIEAISHAAVPGYFMSSIEAAVAVQDIFGPGNVCLLVDTFHAAATDFDVVPWISENSYRIGHVHVADHPGRHEPGTGRFPFKDFLTALQTEGYEDAIGFEYIPAATTEAGLAFLQSWKSGQWGTDSQPFLDKERGFR